MNIRRADRTPVVKNDRRGQSSQRVVCQPEVPLRYTLLVCALIACSTDPDVRFTQLATLPTATEGVVLWSDGQTAEAAMAEQVCTVDLYGGDVLGDTDLAPGQEQLLDGDGERTLIRADGVLYTMPAGVQVAEQVFDAHLVDGGVRALVAHDGRCAVTDGSTAVAIPKTRCDGPVSFDVDPVTGTAWIADGRSLSVLTVDGRFARRDGVDAEHVLWDAASGAVIATERGATLSRLEPDGHRTWTLELAGPALDLDLSQRAGVLAVMVDEPEGARLQIVDVESGEIVGEHPLPASGEVSLSEDGDRMALATDSEVLFYELTLDGRNLRLPEDSGAAGRWSGLGVAGVVAGMGLTVVD